MSTTVEREGGASTLLSALGAWLALGAGLGLLILTLFSILGLVHLRDFSQDPELRLTEALSTDLTAAVAETVRVSPSGDVLEFQARQRNSGELLTISYYTQQGALVREAPGEGKRFLGATPELRFLKEGTLLLARWSGPDELREVRIALDRWASR